MTVDNPKALMGRQKVDMSNTPDVSLIYLAAAHDLGAIKYDPFNWREIPIRAKDYVAAIRRHVTQWSSGEDIDPDSGLSHLACAMAGCSIVLDAMHQGTLIDDRATTPGLTDLMASIAVLKGGWKERFAPAA